jgi:ribosomal protein S27E
MHVLSSLPLARYRFEKFDIIIIISEKEPEDKSMKRCSGSKSKRGDFMSLLLLVVLENTRHQQHSKNYSTVVLWEALLSKMRTKHIMSLLLFAILQSTRHLQHSKSNAHYFMRSLAGLNSAYNGLVSVLPLLSCTSSNASLQRVFARSPMGSAPVSKIEGWRLYVSPALCRSSKISTSSKCQEIDCARCHKILLLFRNSRTQLRCSVCSVPLFSTPPIQKPSSSIFMETFPPPNSIRNELMPLPAPT